MRYGIFEIRKNVFSLLKTKLFYRGARLIRFPIYIRYRNHVHFGKGFTTGYNCRIEAIMNHDTIGEIMIGEHVHIGDNVHIVAANKVVIGNHVLIASHVFITDCSHGDYHTSCIYPNPSDHSPHERTIIAKQTCIGNNVWVGENVVILPGVDIGSGCVIGASSVVTKSIPPNCIVAGNPATILKRYNENTKSWILAKEQEIE